MVSFSIQTDSERVKCNNMSLLSSDMRSPKLISHLYYIDQSDNNVCNEQIN